MLSPSIQKLIQRDVPAHVPFMQLRSAAKAPGRSTKRRKISLFFAFFLSFQAILGCSQVEVLVRQSPPTIIPELPIAVAPARILMLAPEGIVGLKASLELPVISPEAKKSTEEPKTDAPEAGTRLEIEQNPAGLQAFQQGLSVGHLHMAGGYVVVETERGMQYRSKTIELGEEQRYRRLASAWLDKAVDSALTWSRIDHSKVEAPALLSPLLQHELRGSWRDDLRDNQNLPRFELEARPLDKAILQSLPDLHGATMLLQPYIVNYYSHNGGWFVGQNFGTGSGSRIRIFWVLWNVVDGSVLRFGSLQARHLEKYVFSPNSTQIDDYLLEVEKALDKSLRKRLLR